MSLVKTVDGMGYEKTGNTKPHKASAKHYELERTSTMYILWYLVRRHKMGLLVTGNIILVLNWAVPQWFDMVRGLLSVITQ